jgi:hypothetical protein
MVNEDIITALKNSIENGDTLANAINILINSGYNPKEVEEASKFVSAGAFTMQEQKPNEELSMPSKKSSIASSKTINSGQPDYVLPYELHQPAPQESPQNSYSSQEIQQIKQEVSSDLSAPPTPSNKKKSEPLTNQLSKIAPPRQSYAKEIILIIVLLLLVGILIGTLLFKDSILNFISGLIG